MLSSSTRASLRLLLTGTALLAITVVVGGAAQAQSIPPSSTTSTSTSTSTTIATTTTTDPCAIVVNAVVNPCASTTTSSQTPGTLPASTTTTTAVTPNTLPPAPAVSVSPTVLTIGQAFNLTSNGWKPGSNVTVTLNSTPVTLGTLVADQTGNVTGSFAVPTGFALGAHTVQLDGTGSSGSAQTLSAGVTVIASNVVAVPPVTTAVTGALPTTGSDPRRLVGMGALLLGAGAAALVVRRRVTN